MARFQLEGGKSRLRTILCPFCDHEIRAKENVVRCWNCGETFEREPDEEEFIFGSESLF
jgi:predicted amidophosphoribosyltransferase